MSLNSLVPRLNISILANASKAIPFDFASSNKGILLFRWLVVGCQAATILITWPLWQAHQLPPMLPLLPLPSFDMGVLLLLSLALIVLKPSAGVAAHTFIVVYAISVDQMRWQPEIVSLALLLVGTLPNSNAIAIGRAHLVALWLFAGFNKFISPGFMNGTAQWMMAGLVHNPPAWLRTVAPYIISCGEMGTGILAIIPRTRKLAAIMAFGIHIGIFLDLSSIGHNWNQSVWPWNIALAFAGLVFIAPWKESLFATVKLCRPLIALVVIYLLISPIGWFVGLSDAYMTYHLYSSDVPRCSSPAFSSGATWNRFNVPMPPEHRICEQWFQLVCHAGEKLTINDSRWWFRIQGQDVTHLNCPTP
jgi:hypothetical protein